MAVLVGVVQAHRAAVGQADPAGTLHLEEEEFDGIIDIEQRLARQLVALGRDFGPRPVRQHLVALQPAAHALVLQLREHCRQVDGQQVVRHATHRLLDAFGPQPAAAQQGLVIAGDQAIERTVAVGDGVGREVLLEETAGIETRLAVGSPRQIADALPAIAVGPAGHAATGEQEGRPGRRHVVIAPARQVGPGSRHMGTRKGRHRRRNARAGRAARARRTGRRAGRRHRHRSGRNGRAAGEQREQGKGKCLDFSHGFR